MSKSEEVAVAAVNVMAKLHQELLKQRLTVLADTCFTWLVEKGGLQFIMLGEKRYGKKKRIMHHKAPAVGRPAGQADP